jgi:hypothetical protein
MSRKFLTNVDLTGLQLGNLRLENRTSDPTTAYGKGHVYFNTTNNELRWYSGTAWVGLGVSVTDAIAAEATARIAGDATTLASANSALSSAIATEVTNRNSAITTAVSNLVASAPAALDTLNEIAAALGNDATLSTTLTNSIATKLSLAGGTMTGTIVGKKITTDFYALDYNDVPHKGAMSDAINGGVGYGIGVAQTYTDTKIALEVLDRNVNIANAKNEAVGISQTYTNTRETAEIAARNTAIGVETTNRTAAITAAIDAEIIARDSAISTHNADTTAVHGIADTAALATKAYADAAVTVEVADRNTAISAAIATEVAARNTAISTSVNAAIATEVTDRNAAISSAVGTQTTNLTAAIAANSVTDKAYTDTKIATEVTDRNAAIGVETTNRGTAIASAISTEVTDRNTAIAAEASLRITGDSTTLTSANTYTDGKFTALTSSAVPEGTNLYYTQERVQDEINNTLVMGTNLTSTYNDTAGTYTLGLGSAVVTLTGTQTLTNKTLTNPYINDVAVLLATSTELNKLSGVTATATEINKLAGLTATTTQLNYVTGVTSSIQTQFSGKSDTSHTHSFQAASNELTALAGLTGTGFVKRTGTNTYATDNSTYALATSPTINTSIISGTATFNLINTLAATVNFAGAATALSVGSNDPTSVTTLNAPSIIGNLNYVNLYNTGATTVSFAGAATTLNIGGTPTGAVTHNYSANATLSGITKTVNIGTGGANGSITNINLGSSTSGAGGALSVNLPTTFNASTVVPYPTIGTQAANKEYVDNIASGLTIKNQVVYTTSANLSSVYVNGTSDSTGGLGVGATLTASVNGALVLDGVGVTVNQRVLVKDQTDAKQNGIYVTTNPGDAVTKWILTRATDFNGNLNAGTIKPGNYIFVTSGTYLANSSWIVSNSGTSVITSGAIKVGTDVINLAQYSGVPLNISTLGYVTIGTWAATPIADAYIDTAIARTASPTFTGHVHVPLVPVDNADATSKKYVDDLIFASLPYLPDIIPLDDLRYIFDDRESRFEPRHQGIKVPLYNPLRLMITLNGVVQTPSYPEYAWQSMLPLDGFMLDNDGYIAFTQVPPAGSTFDGRVMLGPNVNTIGKAYPFRAMDILLGG